MNIAEQQLLFPECTWVQVLMFLLNNHYKNNLLPESRTCFPYWAHISLICPISPLLTVKGRPTALTCLMNVKWEICENHNFLHQFLTVFVLSLGSWDSRLWSESEHKSSFYSKTLCSPWLSMLIPPEVLGIVHSSKSPAYSSCLPVNRVAH